MPRHTKSDIEKIFERAKAAVEAMSPAEYKAMLDAQRESWARAMAPCEHGIRDWEDCPDCRREATQKAGA